MTAGELPRAAVTNAEAGAPEGASATAAVEMRGIVKRFGSVVACDAIDLTVRGGRILGLLGENGAGKTTLMKVLLGLHQPDAGEIQLDGRTTRIRDPMHAASLGFAMVHQHFSLVDALTVWENVSLGERGRIDAASAMRRVGDVARSYGLDIDPRARVGDLSAGQRQRVEIVKCLSRKPRVLVLDEPTSVLTVAESRDLFATLRRVVQSEGQAVIFISHKLDEIIAATDEVVILRRGRVVAGHRSADVGARQLAREMVGREVSLRAEGVALGLLAVAETQDVSATVDAAPVTDAGRTATPAALCVRDAEALGPDRRRLLDGLDLEVRAGEILGLAGVEGNGQATLGDVLSSLIPLSRGTVEVEGRAVPTGRAGAMHRAGISVVPEDRHRSGCVLDMSVAENLFITELDTVSRGGFLNRRRMRERAMQLIEEFGITAPSSDVPMRALSGGNQQRVILARELSCEPKVLVAAHATRGLDVGAIEYVNQCLVEVARRGVAVLLISAELEEILALSHRIAVIHRGRVIGEMARAEADVERIGLLMGGQAA